MDKIKMMDPAEKQKMVESRMTKEEYERHQADNHKRDHPEDYNKKNLFLGDEFKSYAKEKYPHEHGDEVYENSQILQMIYALEWYDVPRKDYGYLVEYHPYLTEGD